jgi:hypothetical protein
LKGIPLAEAARPLGISRGAAYKRVQRKTLAHTKLSDGRVYVYLDGGRDGKKQANSGQDDSGDDGNPKFSLGLVLQLAGAILVPLGTLAYVLGLLAFWIPIKTAYTHDFAAAWYAAALVPKTVVAGQGVTSLLGLPVLVGVVFVPYLLLWVYLTRYLVRLQERVRRRSTSSSPTSPGRPLPRGVRTFSSAVKPTINLISLGFGVFAVGWWVWALIYSRAPLVSKVGTVLVFAVPLLGWYVFEQHLKIKKGVIFWVYLAVLLGATKALIMDVHETLVVEVTVVLVYMGPLVGGYASRIALHALNLEGDAIRIANSAYLFLGAALFVSFIFGIGLLQVVGRDKPALPLATITRTIETEGKTSEIEGPLLAHTEGFWYVFHRDGKKQPWQLVAISDTRVKTAHIYSERK